MWYHSISIQGRRPYNEDEYNIINNLNCKDITLHKVGYFGLFDGHGGGKISKFCKKNLHKYFIDNEIISKPPCKSKDYDKYIMKAYSSIQNKLSEHEKEAKTVGSTALVVIVYEKEKKKYCKIANLGDCRAIMCNEYNIAVQLTKDHKPTSFEEYKRIISENGKITKDAGDDYRINGMSVSKSFGDLDAKPHVSHIPDIFDYDVHKTKFMIMGCDGLWDVLSNQEAIDFVLSEIECNDDYKKNINNKSDNNIANKLANLAYDKGSHDNITVIVIFF
jgi:protein phosphatase 2C family protein 2/3